MSRRAWLAALVAGLAWGAAPTGPLGPVLALIGAGAAAHAVAGRPAADAARGFVLGLLWFGLQLGWLPEAWSRFAGGHGWAAWAALVTVQALLPALVHVAAGLVIRRGESALLAVPLAWVAVEGLAGPAWPLPFGPSILFVDAPALIGPAALAGRAALSGVAIAVAGLSLQRPSAGIAALGLWLLSGALVAAGAAAETPRVRVGLVQPNTGSFDARRASTAAARASRLRQAVDALAHQGVDLVVTPEGAWPFAPGEPGSSRRAALADAWRGAPAVVLGAAAGEPLPGNALLTVVGAEITDRFDKRALVPVAERRVLGLGKDRYRAGHGPRALTVGGLRIGPLVCYEDLLPGALREAVREDVEVLVAATDDGWLGAGAGAADHLAATRLAAIETGRWVLRPTANGTSAVLDPVGRVRWHAAWVDGDLHPDAEPTVWAFDVPRRRPVATGATLAPISATGALFGLGLLAWRRRRP